MAGRALTRLPRLIVWPVALALIWITVVLAGAWTERARLATLRDRSTARLGLYTAVLEKELARYDYLPAAVRLSPEVRELLRRPGDPGRVTAVNRYLQALNAVAGAADLYVLDRNGTTLAASNWDEEVSFVGVDLSYRPYFQDALLKGSGSFYGIGTTSGEPGYYRAETVRVDGEPLGVAVVKVTLDEIGDLWTGGPVSAAMVVDGDGVVILASEPDWRYHVLTPLPPTTLERYRRTRRFENVPLASLDLRAERELGPNERIVSLLRSGRPGERQRSLAQDRPLAGAGWQIIVLSELEDLALVTRSAQAVAGLVLGLLLLTTLYLRQRRRALALEHAAKAELERRVEERTRDLLAANERLRHEVAERERAERTLREAQDGLVHAGKLAALGQIAAGLTHELNQPLAALRSLSDNAAKLLDRGLTGDVRTNLGMIAGIVDRMAGLTGQLKTFARRSTGRPERPEPARVDRCLANALVLVDRRVREQGVTVAERVEAGEVEVLCDPARLEQVLVNLLANALDALRNREGGRIEIGAGRADGRARITVADNGPGITPEAVPRLFEPFFTTKEAGAGLGLGLTISEGIVREYGGTLRARGRAEGGAEFVVELPGPPRGASGDADA